jgi:inorganic pyrophosphatase
MKHRPINATHYDRIPAYPSPKKKRENVVHAVVETPKHSCHKYALAAGYGIIAFHAVLPQQLEWPYDYGFVPQTLAPDGDPLDVLVVNQRGLFSGCLLEVRIIGAVLETKDGIENDRLVGVPLPSPGAPLPTDGYRLITDLPPDELRTIKGFLAEYSRLQGHIIRTTAVVDADEAMDLVRATRKAFRKSASAREA